MVRTEKKKPSSKGRVPRKKKNRLKDLAPILAVVSLLAAFLAWRLLAVLPGHGIPKAERPPSMAEHVNDKPEPQTEKKKPPSELKPVKAAPPEIKPPKTAIPQIKPKKEPPSPDVAEKKEKPAESLPVQIPSASGDGKVSIVIDDVGSNIELLKEAMKLLPKSATFAVIPFQLYSRESAELLHREGFHVILHSPMEAEDQKKDKGLILAGMSQREVSAILGRQLESVPYAEGVNNHTGSKATKDPVLMTFVMNELKNRGLYFLDSRTTPFTVALKTARSCGVRSTERKVFLDDDSSESGILLKVDELALLGIKEKKVVGIGHLRPNTIQVLSKRLSYWQMRGVLFVPLRDTVE
jgi:uncharacterized protein